MVNIPQLAETISDAWSEVSEEFRLLRYGMRGVPVLGRLIASRIPPLLQVSDVTVLDFYAIEYAKDRYNLHLDVQLRVRSASKQSRRGHGLFFTISGVAGESITLSQRELIEIVSLSEDEQDYLPFLNNMEIPPEYDSGIKKAVVGLPTGRVIDFDTLDSLRSELGNAKVFFECRCSKGKSDFEDVDLTPFISNLDYPKPATST